jgi:hypothetical protein
MIMNTTEIKILLDKYYEGETTLDEEKILRRYFTSGNVDQELAEYAPLFGYQASEAKVQPSENLDAKLTATVSKGRKIAFYNQRNFWIYFSGIAASLLFIASLIFETQLNTQSKNPFADTQYSEAETRKAYEQTKTALAYVSGKYTTATEPLGEISKLGKSTIAATQMARFNNQLKNINTNMSKVDDGVDNLSKLSKFTIIVKP